MNDLSEREKNLIYAYERKIVRFFGGLTVDDAALAHLRNRLKAKVIDNEISSESLALDILNIYRGYYYHAYDSDETLNSNTVLRDLFLSGKNRELINSLANLFRPVAGSKRDTFDANNTNYHVGPRKGAKYSASEKKQDTNEMSGGKRKSKKSRSRRTKGRRKRRTRSRTRSRSLT
jgi:hypothetical protein